MDEDEDKDKILVQRLAAVKHVVFGVARPREQKARLPEVCFWAVYGDFVERGGMTAPEVPSKHTLTLPLDGQRIIAVRIVGNLRRKQQHGWSELSMEECLRSIRFGHQALLPVCVAILNRRRQPH